MNCSLFPFNSRISPNIFPHIRKTHPKTIIQSFILPANKWSIPDDFKFTSLHLNNDYLTKYRSSAVAMDGSSMKEPVEEIRRVLRNVGEDPLEALSLLDTLQRLGIDHHYQEDIQAALCIQHKRYSNQSYSMDELYEVSTSFRLLRQDGFNVDPDVFEKFIKREGMLRLEPSKYIKGLMGLYEASQLSMEGEDILDYAREYSAKVLSMWMPNLDHHQAKIVNATLRNPYHKNLSRFFVKDFISDHKYHNKWINTLQEQVDMEFSYVRAMQKEELFQVTKWWKETGLAKELKFARDQPLRWYMWSAVMLMDLGLSEERVDLMKSFAFIYIIDDIYDVYGTLDELTMFTEVVKRWDLHGIKKLPSCMQMCFEALDNTTNEISNKIYKKHRLNPVEYLRKTWALLCDAFLVEAKWFASGRLPTADAYLNNGIISSGVHIGLVHMFFLLGHRVNEETINLVNSNPSIITSTATIVRLWNDLGSKKDENQGGYDGSFVECYMNDTRCSVETARKQSHKMISDSWKCLNKETLSPTSPFSATFRQGCLNIAIMASILYSYDENRKLIILEEYVKSVLYDNVNSQVQGKPI